MLVAVRRGKVAANDYRRRLFLKTALCRAAHSAASNFRWIFIVNDGGFRSVSAGSDQALRRIVRIQ